MDHVKGNLIEATKKIFDLDTIAIETKKATYQTLFLIGNTTQFFQLANPAGYELNSSLCTLAPVVRHS